MKDILLTICIPTYNRKERLCCQLDSLYCQDDINKVNVLLIDNDSPYDINIVIKEHFKGEIPQNMEIHRNPVNICLEGNIVMPFFLAKTPWIWTLSDDDLTQPNSISKVLQEIGAHPDASQIIFSITGFFPHENKIIDNIDNFINYWDGVKHTGGDLVFLSNKVCNLTKIKPYLGQALRQCFNAIAHIIPILLTLNERVGYVYLSSEVIVSYKKPAVGSEWNYGQIMLSFSNISYLELNIKEYMWKNFCGIFAQGFSILKAISVLLRYNPRYRGKFIFDECYNKMLKYHWSCRHLYKFFFDISYYLHLNNLSASFLEEIYNRRCSK